MRHVRGPRVLIELRYLHLPGRAAGRREKGAGGLGVLDDEILELPDLLERGRGQRSFGCAAQRRGNGVKDQTTGKPARRSIEVSAISGRPMRAGGARVSVAGMRAGP